MQEQRAKRLRGGPCKGRVGICSSSPLSCRVVNGLVGMWPGESSQTLQEEDWRQQGALSSCGAIIRPSKLLGSVRIVGPGGLRRCRLGLWEQRYETVIHRPLVGEPPAGSSQPLPNSCLAALYEPPAEGELTSRGSTHRHPGFALAPGSLSVDRVGPKWHQANAMLHGGRLDP
jgi:hypothetical protein